MVAFCAGMKIGEFKGRMEQVYGYRMLMHRGPGYSDTGYFGPGMMDSWGYGEYDAASSTPR